MAKQSSPEERRREQTIAIFHILQEQLEGMVKIRKNETNPKIKELLDVQIKGVRASCQRIVDEFTSY